MLIDYHLHNHFSPDSEENTRNILEKAIEKGVKEVCITNHLEWHDKNTGKSIFDYSEGEKRFQEIQEDLKEARKQFPNIQIKFGTELEYGDTHMDEVAEFVKNTPFDFILGSVHIVNGVIISSHKFADALYERADEKTAYHAYFDNMEKLIEWGHLDVTAHFDICKKGGYKFYGPFDPERHKDRILPILKRMKEKKIGIELNTKCVDNKCQEIFPHHRILEWAVETGIEYFTLGSDGHKRAHACNYLEEALEIAKKAGVKELSTYSRRQATKHSI